MAEVQQQVAYLNEHLWVGQIGHLAMVTLFVTAILAIYSFFKAGKLKNAPWMNLGTSAFLVHTISTLLVIGLLLYSMFNRFYEYNFVFEQVSDDLPTTYVFVAFWEGQIGSFLLWMFWNIAMGWMIWRSKSEWAAPVLGFMLIIQAFLASMVLGIYLPGDIPIGRSPFTLLRDLNDAPIFSSADYIQSIRKMANGLNVLLQNYWNVIHPPTLFLGFAATAVPFAFALSGMWYKDHKSWLPIALPWALFAGAVLGTGILLGGAWAYEALSFGGYWAWDPVENTSFVPWLILVAGIHTNLIARNTGYSVKSTYGFYGLAFLLVVYSTFLTRSGILADTSAHAFTEMGLQKQLLLYLGTLMGLFVLLYIRTRKSIPVIEQEEKLSSREFWMFIGSLVLLFSAILITYTTSIPVYNKVFDGIGSLIGKDLSSWHRAMPLEPIAHYNKFQVWVAFFLGLLTGLSQWLRYRALGWDQNKRSYFSRLAFHAAGALALTLLVNLWLSIHAWQYQAMLFASSFAVIANTDYLIRQIKGNIKLGASALSHAGLGVMLIGILSSGLNQDIISKNTNILKEDFGSLADESLFDNVYLTKNIPQRMRDYTLLYKKDTIIRNERFYDIDIYKQGTDGKMTDKFTIHPGVVYDDQFAKILSVNPSIQRYWNRDLFTLVAQVNAHHSGNEALHQLEDSLTYRKMNTHLKDTFETKTVKAWIEAIAFESSNPDYQPEPGDLCISPIFMLESKSTGKIYRSKPSIVLRGNVVYSLSDVVNEVNTKIRLSDDLLDEYFRQEASANYSKLELKQGQEAQVQGYTFHFVGFNRHPEHPMYRADSSDIAISAFLEILAPNGSVYQAEPIYYIRGNRPYNIPVYLPDPDLMIRFTHVDPGKETIELQVGNDHINQWTIPFEISSDYPRDDYVVLQAKIFPGINLFWSGGLLMMAGLGLALWSRKKQRRSTNA